MIACSWSEIRHATRMTATSPVRLADRGKCVLTFAVLRQPITNCRLPKIFWRHMAHEPDAGGGAVEGEAGGMHRGVYGEDDGATVAAANGDSGGHVRREVDMVPLHLAQPLALNRRRRALAGAVIEYQRWLQRL